MDGSQQVFETWAVVELLGHRRLAGYVREVTIAGSGLLRVDVPGEGEEILATQIFPAASLYALTICTEEVARRETRLARGAPMQALDVPALPGRQYHGGWQQEGLYDPSLDDDDEEDDVDLFEDGR